jgi:hypothetical protein
MRGTYPIKRKRKKKKGEKEGKRYIPNAYLRRPSSYILKCTPCL